MATTPEKCPHSHLSVEFLDKVGKVVEKIGEGAVTAAITAVLAKELEAKI